MIAAARTAGVREDQNLLRAVHERLCLGDIGTGATGLKLLAPIASDDQPSGSPGDLGYLVGRSEEHTSELQSLMRISYAVFCLKKKKKRDRFLTDTYRNK